MSISVQKVFKLNIKGQDLELSEHEAVQLRDYLIQLLPIKDQPPPPDKKRKRSVKAGERIAAVISVMSTKEYMSIQDIAGALGLVSKSGPSSILKELYKEGKVLRQRSHRTYLYKLRDFTYVPDKDQPDKISIVPEQEGVNLSEEQRIKDKLHRDG